MLCAGADLHLVKERLEGKLSVSRTRISEIEARRGATDRDREVELRKRREPLDAMLREQESHLGSLAQEEAKSKLKLTNLTEAHRKVVGLALNGAQAERKAR